MQKRPDPDSNTRYDAVRCRTCGVPWKNQAPACSRHPYSPLVTAAERDRMLLVPESARRQTANRALSYVAVPLSALPLTSNNGS